jgi:cephalosporin-C deacetylase-like acetyl esterase
LYVVRWPVFDNLNGEGLLLEPKNAKHPQKTIIHIPHAGVTPEQILQNADHLFPLAFGMDAKEIANCRIIIPATVDRNLVQRHQSTLSNREFIYRGAFQLGRHIIGYEVQEALALVDWIKQENPDAIVRVEGYGDGGLLSFYAAAADTRIDEAVVAGYFNARERLCDEPIDRNVFGLLDQFGDAEIATLIAPRKLIIVNCDAPELVLKSEKGGAPGVLTKLSPEIVLVEVEIAYRLVMPFNSLNWLQFIPQENSKRSLALTFTKGNSFPDATERTNRLIAGMDKHTQKLLDQSQLTRREFWNKLDVSSPEKIDATIEWYRDYFAQEVIGQFNDPLSQSKVRTRFYGEEPTHTIYEVDMDVFGGVTAYGLLLIPKDLKEGEKRPVVVCQHGLERDPFFTIDQKLDAGTNGFPTTLTQRGYVTFVPQGIFAGHDKFRFNQRQLNPLGKTLFSIMVAQHQQILNWLGTLPYVHKDKIGFYGISYGGKTAMRVPSLVKNYALSICSADFNYWNYKNASTLMDFSYIWMNEYEIFEFDMANTFDYSDMTRLIAPRPFMVERGHNDKVALDEYVGFEYAKVRYYYDHCLKLPERTEIHWFDDGHRINGEKEYPFLDKFLKE